MFLNVAVNLVHTQMTNQEQYFEILINSVNSFKFFQ